MKVKLKSVNIEPEAEGFVVSGSDQDGRKYWLAEGGSLLVLGYAEAAEIVRDIKDWGFLIDDAEWLVHAPYGTEAWLLDGQEQRQIEDEAFGF